MAPRYDSEQRRKIRDVVNATGLKESVAAQRLSQNGWTVSAVLDGLGYSKGKKGQMPDAHVTLNRLFEKYHGISVAQDFTTEPDKIGFHGIQAYFNDLNVAFDEPISLAVMEIVKCKTIGEIERDPFINGWLNTAAASSSAVSLDNIPAQSNYLNTSRRILSSDTVFFKSIYRFAFDLLKPEGKRSIASDTAPDCWSMFFTGDKGGMEWRMLPDWLEFYEGPYKKKPVTKDLWNMVAELAFKTREPGGEALGWWNEESAWPAAIDEFVAWMKERTEKMDTS